MVGNTWLDSSGNGNHALVSGSSLALSGSLGFAFTPTSGSENYLTYPASLVATPSSSFTLQFFGSPKSNGNGMTLFGKSEASASAYSNGWFTSWNGSATSTRRIYYYNNETEEVVTPSAIPLATQSLYTITFTAGQNQNGGFYLNDAGAVTQFTPGNIQAFNTASSVPFTFGYDANGGTPNYGFYDGTISNIMVYNRVLSTAEIAQNYSYLLSSACIPPSTTTTTTTSAPTTTSTTTAAPLPIVEEGLVIWSNYADYNSGSGTITDRSPNGNTALVSGSTMSTSGSLGLVFNGTDNYFTYPQPVNLLPTGSYTLQFYGNVDWTYDNLDSFCKEDFGTGWDMPFVNGPAFVYRPYAGGDVAISGPMFGLPTRLITVLFDVDTPEITLYVDDTLAQTAANPVDTFDGGTSVPFTFGWNPQSDATYFIGTFKDITLYNRLLTPTEIAYNNAALSTL